MTAQTPGQAGDVLAAIDEFERDIPFTAPELTDVRISQLRSQVKGIFEKGAAPESFRQCPNCLASVRFAAQEQLAPEVVDRFNRQLGETEAELHDCRAAISRHLRRIAELETLLADAFTPTAGDYDRAADAIAAQERPAPGGLVRQMAALADDFDRTADQCRNSMPAHDTASADAMRKAARASVYRACAVAVRHGLRADAGRIAAAQEQPAPGLAAAMAVLARVRELAEEHASCDGCSLPEELEAVLDGFPATSATEGNRS